mgnify:CR=1 FL=1
MFARTERLLLRPPFAEDAEAIARAIGDEGIVRNLATAPWPYGVADAAAWVARPDHEPLLPNWVMLLRTGGQPRFRPTGRIDMRHSLARGSDTPCALFEEDVDAPVAATLRTEFAEDMREQIRLKAA